MRILLSPAKKMNVDTDTLEYRELPDFLEKTSEILEWLRAKKPEELQALWACNEKIAAQNVERLKHMELTRQLTPAILSYEGIAYQYMAPAVFEKFQLEYVQEHLRILSAFYGVLRPLDGVTPYRLEMQAKAKIGSCKNLYEYWGEQLYQAVCDQDGVILNLASKEYSKCVEKYLKPTDRFVTCVFGEWRNGKILQKGTYAKMARGEMVRFMAEHGIENLEEIRGFQGLEFRFSPEHSDDRNYVFLRNV